MVSAAPTEVEQKLGTSDLFCDACKMVVEQVQENLAQLRPQLDQLCNYCGSPEAEQKCRDKLHELEDKVEHEKPQEVCAAVGMCRRPHSAQNDRTFYDFAGQF